MSHQLGVRTIYGCGVLAIAMSAAIAYSANYAPGQENRTQVQEYSAQLSGFNEVGGLSGQTGANPGAILTNGTGELILHLDKSNLTATYQLTYSDLTSTATMAHIHFGKVHVPGDIIIWLCQTTLKPGPAGTPTCPEPGGTVTGTISASSVQAIPTQNVTAGDFDAFVAALESNTAYSNVHSVNFPMGEIRGQVHLLAREGDPNRNN
jgi:CHRD domain